MKAGESHRMRVLIVEDEERARRTLRQLLGAESDVVLVGETAGPDTVRAIREHEPDLVFLDVEMPGMDGFEVLEALEPEEIPFVIFVTAYEDYALQAFDVAAVDYLLKPYSDERLQTALDRARRSLEDEQLSAVRAGVERVLELVGERGSAVDDGERLPTGTETDAPLVFRDASRTHLVHPTDIDWIEASGVYVRVHAGERSLLVRETLAALERRLEPLGFYRIHRSALVRLDRVVELEHRSHGDYRVLLRDGTELTLARTRKAGLEARLGRSIS